MILSVGGKTFIAGEYLALYGGETLLATTEPRFELRIAKKKDSELSKNIFHPDSPAGKLWLKNQKVLNQFEIEFSDPYQTGGFGASTAQFVLLYSLIHEADLDWKKAIQEYRELAKMSEGFPPSGADLVAMMSGNLSLFSRAKESLESRKWPFEDKDFLLVKTLNKLATHDHLKALPSFDAEPLRAEMQIIYRGLAEKNFETFVLGLRNFREKISALGLTAAATKDFVDRLESHQEIHFAKGCGAMGADVLFLVFDKEKKARVFEIVKQMGLEAQATSDDLTAGITAGIQET